MELLSALYILNLLPSARAMSDVAMVSFVLFSFADNTVVKMNVSIKLLGLHSFSCASFCLGLDAIYICIVV